MRREKLLRLIKQLAPLVVVAAIALIGSRVAAAVQDQVVPTLVVGLATAALAIVGYRWTVRMIERREPVEAARRGAVRSVGRGMLLGVGMFTAVIAVIAAFGGYRVVGWGSVSGAIGLFGFMAAAAVTEELMFRGVLFRIIEQRTGSWIALAVSGIVFGSAHLLNPHATIWGAIAIAIEAGGMLAAGYAATRSLWLPIGLHFGWNFAESAIFGAYVSGTGSPSGLVESATSGPALLTGGEFGPEASLVSVLVGLALTTVFMLIAHRRGRLVPLRRHRATVEPTATLSR